jgi:class 3 adenylate cyclase/alpha-beta hydrolase superfamily lysophospholipase
MAIWRTGNPPLRRSVGVVTTEDENSTLLWDFERMSDFVLPETRYALSGDVNIAYQIMGDGPVDLVLVPGLISHVEFLHELPGYTAALRRLSRFARVVTFDKRGQGLSDRISGAPSLEQRIDDVRAVMDAIGSARAILIGFSEGAAMSVLFAATYPERVPRLVLVGAWIRAVTPDDVWREGLERAVKAWGTGQMLKSVFKSQATNADAVAQLAKLERFASSPGALRTYLTLTRQIDVTPILPLVRIPTLVLHRRGDAQVNVAIGRDIAAQIPGARYIEYPDGDHAFWSGDVESLLLDIEEFVTGRRDSGSPDLERVLATVLFTDIVDSTQRAAQMGDEKWRKLLDEHDRVAGQMVENHRGRLVKSTGDGILATFDGPGRAVKCALSFGAAAQQFGPPLRAGLHTGEIEVRGRDIGGIAVHAAARVMAQSGSNEVLVSRVVTDLVAGAGLRFSDRGSFELKGLPGRWDLYAVSM